MADDEPRPEPDEGEDERERWPAVEPPVELPPGKGLPERDRGHTLPIEPIDPT
jgi:hypothetical protein